ncbi:MAG: CarD family transcriptional regulator [Actinomycetes bacterium]
MKFKKGDTVIYPQHGACKVESISKQDPLNTGKVQDYLVLRTVIGEMTLRVPMSKVDEVGVRPPVSPDELEDLVAVLAKADPRVPSNWSRRFKNHQEKLKSGDVYQVAEVVRNLAARNRDASLSAAERTMYERARVNLISEIAPALKVTTDEAEQYLDDALAKGVLKPVKVVKAVKALAPKVEVAPKEDDDDLDDDDDFMEEAKPVKAAPAKKAAAEKKPAPVKEEAPAKAAPVKKATPVKAAVEKKTAAPKDVEPAKAAPAKKAVAKKPEAKKK